MRGLHSNQLRDKDDRARRAVAERLPTRRRRSDLRALPRHRLMDSIIASAPEDGIRARFCDATSTHFSTAPPREHSPSPSLVKKKGTIPVNSSLRTTGSRIQLSSSVLGKRPCNCTSGPATLSRTWSKRDDRASLHCICKRLRLSNGLLPPLRDYRIRVRIFAPSYLGERTKSTASAAPSIVRTPLEVGPRLHREARARGEEPGCVSGRLLASACGHSISP